MEAQALWLLEYEGVEAYRSFENSLFQSLELSAEGAKKFLDVTTSHFATELKTAGGISNELFKLMKSFSTVVEASFEVGKEISKRGTQYIKDNVPIGLFLSTGHIVYVTVAREVTRILIENCENFTNWKDFVTCDPDKAKLMEKSLIKMETFVKRDPDEKKQRAALNSLFSTAVAHVTNLNKVFCSPSVGMETINRVQSISLAETENLISISKEDEDAIEKKIEESIEVKEKIMGKDFSEEQVLDNVINTVIDTLSQHDIERQNEILDTAQSVILGSIHQIKKKMKKLSQSYNEGAFKELRKQLAETQKKLIKIQKEKHLKKERRMKERHELLQKESGTGVSQQHIDLQQRSVKYLTTLYDTFSQGVIYTDISSELCALDHLLSTVLEVSVSLFVAGLISVGKSTIVNCLTGQNLCPNRTETMTAIPTRYIHSSKAVDPNDPKKVIPRMFIPFYRELNATIVKIQEFLRTRGFDRVRSQIRKVHLVKLLTKINQGNFNFEDKYVGEEDILEASTDIHDLFRIGCSEIFPSSILAGLPLSWRSGPDHYLTVITKFPSIDVATDLVEFSIIDTPGIDEDGVKELHLENTLKEVCEACNFAALITTPTGFNSIAMAPLKHIFESAKLKFHVPSLAIATSADTVPKKEDRESTKLGISATLKDAKNEREIFNTNEVFFVSAKKYFLGTKMLSCYESNGTFPQLSDSPRSSILDDFLFVAYPGREEDQEREDEYRKASPSDIKDKCNRLIQNSYMEPLLARMIQTSVFNGIPVCVHNAIEKAQKHVKRGLKKMKLASKDENITRTTALINDTENSIKTILTNTSDGFTQDLIRIKGIAQQVLSDISRGMEERRNTPLPKEGTLGDFVGYYALFVRDLRTDIKQAQDLVQTRETQQFSSEDDFRKAILALVGALKGAIQGYTTMKLWTEKKKIFETGNRQRDQIIQKLEKVRSECASTLKNLKQSQFEIRVNEVPTPDKEEADISPLIENVMRKNNQTGIFSRITNFFSTNRVISTRVEYGPIQEYLEDYAISYSQFFVQAFIAQLEKNMIDINATLAGANNTLTEYQDALLQLKFNPSLNDPQVKKYFSDLKALYKSKEPENLLTETKSIIASIQTV